MATPDKFKNSSPAAITLAGAALLNALFEELVHSQIITKDAAGRELGSWSTQGPFGDAGILLRLMQDEIIKES